MASRDVILGSIRDSLKRPAPAELHRDPGPVWPPVRPAKTGLDRFREAFAALRGVYAEARVPEEVGAHLERLARAQGWTRVYATDAPLLAHMKVRETLRRIGIFVESPYVKDDAGRNRPAGLDALVTGVDFVLAETATFAHVAKPGEGRMTTLTAPVHVALFTDDQVVETLEDALARAGGAIARGERSCMTWITGPSRTADIENSLTIGVHGPGELHALRVTM